MLPSFSEIELSATLFDAPLYVTDTLEGMVTTNAMAYTGNVPTFTNGFLDYNVAGRHYLPGGAVAQGTYDLLMTDSVARCLYDFMNAPISATVSITDDSSGQANIAITSVSDTGGWLHVGAYDFTFSNPTIQVHLTGKTAKATGPVRTTILCVSKKCVRIRRRVTGIFPHCPFGFRHVKA
jgi:hypothetical protein